MNLCSISFFFKRAKRLKNIFRLPFFVRIFKDNLENLFMVHFIIFCMGKIIFNLFCLLFLQRKKYWLVIAWFFKNSFCKCKTNSGFLIKTNNKKETTTTKCVRPPPTERINNIFWKLWVDDLKCVLFCFVCLLEKYQPKTNKNYLAPYSPVFIQITVVFWMTTPIKKKQKKRKPWGSKIIEFNVFDLIRSYFILHTW